MTVPAQKSKSASRLERFLERTMDRSVPLGLVLAIVILFSLGTVAFAWYVKRSVFLRDESWPAQTAVAVASLPTDMKKAVLETGQRLSGEWDLRYIRATPSDERRYEFTPVDSAVEGTAGTLMVGRGPGTPAVGWRLMVGAFRIGGSIEDGAIVLSPDLKIVHYWLLGEGGPVNADPDPPSWNVTHGFLYMEDGSVIHAFRDGHSLNRTDRCGRTIWEARGDYHHSVTLDERAGAVWAIRDDEGEEDAERTKLVQIAVEDGRILKEFSIGDIISANPQIDILELRRHHQDNAEGNTRGTTARWLVDPFHFNDADPLPPALAERFPQFSPGDLLVSARETNLLFVVDPATLSVKWWRIGATIRQHDPDWQADGSISVYNNRMGRKYSAIVAVDPRTNKRTVAVDGRASDFYSRIRGNHQRLPEGGWLVASTQQGRVLEFDSEGQVALDFRAPLDEEGTMLGFLTDVVFLPDAAIDPGCSIAQRIDLWTEVRQSG